MVTRSCIARCPVDDADYQTLVDFVIRLNGDRFPDNGMECQSIAIDARNLLELKGKRIAWLKSNANESCGSNTFFVENPTWSELVKSLLDFDLHES
jgi:hypothetical protein